MRRVLWAGGLLALTALPTTHGAADDLPDVATKALEAATPEIGNRQGRGLVLNLFATWCTPCLDEFPALERMREALAARGAPVDVVAVSTDLRSRQATSEFVREHELGLPVRFAPRGGLEKAFRVVGYPTTLLVDGRGSVVERVLGPREWAAAEWIERARALAAPVSDSTVPR